MIELNNVCKTYKTGTVKALDHVSLSIPKGAFIAITGTSGSGKSTLLNTVAGIDTIDSGEIILNNQPIHTISDDDLTRFRAHHIGFVFQFFNLLDSLTVLENVMLPLECQTDKQLNIEQKRERATQILRQVELNERLDFYPAQLSGGQMQRAAIARALVHQPPIILSDEPTGNLDSQTGETVLNILISLCREYNSTLLMVTHDPACVDRADVVYTMQDGQLV